MSQHRKRQRLYRRLCQRHASVVEQALRRAAQRIGRGDRALVDDLVQEGYAEIWMAGPRIMQYDDPLLTAIVFARRRMRRYMHRAVRRHERVVHEVKSSAEGALALQRASRRAERRERRHEDMPEQGVELRSLERELEMLMFGHHDRREAA